MAHFQRAIMMDIARRPRQCGIEETLTEIEDFLEGFNQPTTAACGSMGSGSLPGHPRTDGQGTAGPMRSGSTSTEVSLSALPYNL